MAKHDKVFEMWGNGLMSLNDNRLKSLPANIDVGLPPKMTLQMMNRGVGIEIETEGWDGRDNYPNPFGWKHVNDGSLRMGREYITIYGSRVFEVPTLLKNISGSFLLNKFVPKFSPRTSVHVHLDLRYFPLSSLEALLILYTVFEDSLFKYSGNRVNNIFCVPLRYSSLMNKPTPGGLYADLRKMTEDSDKYSAFNLASLAHKGTVEFRHMEGNLDVDRISTWVLLLACLTQYARRTQLKDVHDKVINIKSSSAYDVFKKEVFGNLAGVLPTDPVELDRSLTESKIFFNYAGDK